MSRLPLCVPIWPPVCPAISRPVTHNYRRAFSYCCLSRALNDVHPAWCAGDGDLFLWGSNKRGQLTATEAFLSTPTPVKRSLLGGEKVAGAWSGWTHVAAQTGERRASRLWGPAVLTGPNGNVVVSERGRHSFISESGRVFTWGRGDYGQLGRRASTRQNPTCPSPAGGDQEARLPAEVAGLRGATQVSALHRQTENPPGRIVCYCCVSCPFWVVAENVKVRPAGGSRPP